MLNLERQDNGTIKKKLLCHNFDLNRAAYPLPSIKGRHKNNENVIRGEQYCPQKLTFFMKCGGFTATKSYYYYTKAM